MEDQDKKYYVNDNGCETCFEDDKEAACEAAREANRDGRCAYVYSK